MSRKRKIVLQTDNSIAKTGFGRFARALLTYLYKTDKYDIVHYSLGIQHTHPATLKTPWKTIGCLPDNPNELNHINKDPAYAKQVNYGALYLDKVIKDEKPDVFFAVQDIWGVDFTIDKKWFNKITSAIWTTLDSLPLLPIAIDKASKVKNYWVWSNFAEKELHRLGHTHVKTMHGPVDCSQFKKLPDKKKAELRLGFNKYIPVNAFVAGFVFRNQLRKSVPNLLEGYSLFRQRVSEDKPTRLLLHTNFSEGWDILKLVKEYNIPLEEILTTYVCALCKKYAVANFVGQNTQCPFCKADKAFSTTGVACGVSEKDLNEVYNLMDVYVHPFTSGGQEIPIQEAKLTELVTLVTNYSCGEEQCEEAAQSLPLDWAEFREHQTQFKKASTNPRSISKQLKKVYDMKPQKREKMGAQARRWVLDNYSVESIGKKIEDFIDNAPLANYDFINLEEEAKDPNAIVPSNPNKLEWIKSLYKNILKMEVTEKDEGVKYWLSEIEKGKEEHEVDKYFRRVAIENNMKNENKKSSLDQFVDKDDKGKRVLYVMPGSIGDVFMSTSLFKSIKESYPDHNLYVATNGECLEILDGNPHVHRVIPFQSYMENLQYLEGTSDNEGWFEIAYLPFVNTQRILTYMHNGKDKIAYKDLKYEN